MKFAKYDVLSDVRMSETVLTMLIRELDQDAVPEWRAKYLDYRVHSSPLSSQTQILYVHGHTIPHTDREHKV
jgi:hypothetical protein